MASTENRQLSEETNSRALAPPTDEELAQLDAKIKAESKEPELTEEELEQFKRVQLDELERYRDQERERQNAEATGHQVTGEEMMQNLAKNWAEIGKRNRQAIAALGEQQEAKRKRLEAWDNYTAAEFWAKQSEEIHKFNEQYFTYRTKWVKQCEAAEQEKVKAKKRDRVLTGLKWVVGASLVAAGSLLVASSVKNTPPYPVHPADRAFNGFSGVAGIGLGALYALF